MTTAFRHSSWLVTASLAAIAVAYLTFVWMPGRRAIQAMQRQVEVQHQFVDKSTGLQASLMAVQQELERTESVAARWERLAPREKDIPSLYGKISALAKDAGLTVSKFDPQPWVGYEQIREIPVSIHGSGSFAQLYDFLRRVEGLPVAIWVKSMKIEKTAASAKDIQSELELVVFSNNP